MTGQDNNSNDLQTSSVVVPLLDPIGRVKVVTPVRGKTCRHIRCFDLQIYYDNSNIIAKKIPCCPICHSKVPLSSLIIDEYMQNILQNVVDDVDEVIIAADGNWKEHRSGRKKVIPRKCLPDVVLIDSDVSPRNSDVHNIPSPSISRQEILKDPCYIINLSDDHKVQWEPFTNTWESSKNQNRRSDHSDGRNIIELD